MDTNQSANTSTFATKEENEHLSALEQEKARLENAVKHLERSNAELAEALAAGPDRDFEEAVKENARVLSDYQQKIYKLAVEIAGKAVQIHGGNGITKEFSVERHFRNAKVMPIPDGTTEIQKLVIGRNLTGVNAF